MNGALKANLFNYLQIFLVLCSFSLAGFSQNTQQDYKRTSNGLKYKILKAVGSPRKPGVGDVVTLSVVYKTPGDSLIFDSRLYDYDFSYSITPYRYKADFNEALCLLGVGDSAVYFIKADSFYLKTLGYKAVPAGIRKGIELKFNVKLLGMKTNEEYMQEQATIDLKAADMKKKLQQQETESLAKYLEVHKVSVSPAESGLYYIAAREGKGEQAKKGKTVRIDFKGRLLNGTAIDSTGQSGMPHEFVLGEGKVIRGWEEGIMKMKAGGKATLIIPSSLAFGENELERIPPFSTLVYDIELIEVR
jgi:FKBP-type peptidyl-prolyl cis-trans isomerase FkpA